MPSHVHPTAILEGEVTLAEDVRIGPWCVINGPARIGPGTVLLGQNFLQGPIELGAGNVLYPGVHLGFAPQSLRYDPQQPGHGLVIGDRNIFREGVTIHRAMTDEGPTRIGNANFFMANAHAGHDAQIGHHCVFANGTLIAGHVVVEDRVITGGNATVHQFVRLGRGCMVSGLVGTGYDVLPWMMVTAINIAGGINLVGLRRSGASAQDIDDMRWIYRVVCRMNLLPAGALERLRERADRPLVAEAIAFFGHSTRGILRARGKAARGTA